jgi:pyruvyltransferase
MPRVVHWNPRAALGTGRILTRIKVGPRVDNFGDMLGPHIVARLRTSLGLGPARSRSQRLLAVGSIMHLARDGDVVWGTGINGKMLQEAYPRLDVRAVRGPLTAERLRRGGVHVPDVFGDPGLLIPRLWTDDELGIERGTTGTVLVPNLHDRARFPADAVDPQGDFAACIRTIASADLVVASSLHGIVVAEAYGVPAVLVTSSTEPPFKYDDYYAGTGRARPAAVATWQEGLDAAPAPPITGWSPEPLLAAFPADLWEPGVPVRARED